MFSRMRSKHLVGSSLSVALPRLGKDAWRGFVRMISIADGSVIIQTSAEAVPSTPSWFGEVVLIVEYLRKHDVLTKLGEGVRFARRRFGLYEVIDFPRGAQRGCSKEAPFC